MNISYLFFSMRNGKACRKVTIQPSQIKKVIVEPRQILLTHVDGTTLTNPNPSPQERSFWLNYKKIEPIVQQTGKQQPIRWDMPSPDPLAMAMLEEYEPPKKDLE